MKSCVGGIGMPRKRWFGIVRQKFLRLSPRHRRETIIVLHTNNTLASSSFAVTVEGDAEEVRDDLEVIGEHSEINAPSSPPTPVPEEDTLTMSTEDNAATMIQAHFRGHLARRAYKALKSLVKLQAVVRGVLVRSQARLALDCMHALARLQVTVRARQLLGNCPATPTY